MTKDFLDELYEKTVDRIVSRCRFNWQKNYDVDKTIYRDIDEYIETKVREVFHHFAVKKGIMK